MTYQMASKLLCDLLSLERETQRVQNRLSKRNEGKVLPSSLEKNRNDEANLEDLIRDKVKAS